MEDFTTSGAALAGANAIVAGNKRVEHHSFQGQSLIRVPLEQLTMMSFPGHVQKRKIERY
jgi:hypothetical protein